MRNYRPAWPSGTRLTISELFQSVADRDGLAAGMESGDSASGDRLSVRLAVN